MRAGILARPSLALCASSAASQPLLWHSKAKAIRARTAEASVPRPFSPLNSKQMQPKTGPFPPVNCPKASSGNRLNKTEGLVKEKSMRKRAQAPSEQDLVQIIEALRRASPDVLAAALKSVKGTRGGEKKKAKKKPCRFRGTDHWITREELEAVCAVSPPMYAKLWRVCAFHALRISEALALRAEDIQNGFLTVRRLKGSRTTVQKLLVNLDEQIASGTYRLFPLHRSSAFLRFRAAAAKVGLRPDLRHPHVLRHSTAHWLLDSGVPLHVASQYLGHTSLASTSAYLNCGDTMASAAAAKVIRPATGHLAGEVLNPPSRTDLAAFAAASWENVRFPPFCFQ